MIASTIYSCTYRGRLVGVSRGVGPGCRVAEQRQYLAARRLHRRHHGVGGGEVEGGAPCGLQEPPGEVCWNNNIMTFECVSDEALRVSPMGQPAPTPLRTVLTAMEDSSGSVVASLTPTISASVAAAGGAGSEFSGGRVAAGAGAPASTSSSANAAMRSGSPGMGERNCFVACSSLQVALPSLPPSLYKTKSNHTTARGL